tara:strand:+ start:446 stop:781 length:336 start_codon:yes stop_codon:yes gene_type:complete
MLFIFKTILAGLLIAFSSWLAGYYPKMAGFIIALPIASLIAILYTYFEHNNAENTIIFAKSILVAVPVSYLFFIPFFFAKQLSMNFWFLYFLGIFLLILGYFIHKFLVNFL